MPGGVSRAAFACRAFGSDGVPLLLLSLARWLLESVRSRRDNSIAMLLLILRLRCMAVLFRSVLPLL